MMSGWLHTLPLVWMTLIVFGAMYLVAFILHQGVAALSTGAAGRSFKALSPGMLPPLGIIFGLFVAFTAAQVWNDNDHANAAVNREASALRSVVVLASSFPRGARDALADAGAPLHRGDHEPGVAADGQGRGDAP